MRWVKQLVRAATRKARPHSAGAVAMIVPHGSADASRDFECAFEMLQGDDRARELWHRESARIPFARAS